MSILGGNDIVFLFGAGASKEAGLFTAEDMICDLEEKVVGKLKKWSKFRELYFFLKSSLLYADGVQGHFNVESNLNIERLVNSMRELEQNEKHPIYPFVAYWSMKLQEHGGESFQNVREFRRQIISELVRKWVHLKRRSAADYYKGIIEFQKNWGAPLHVFNLNYDLCLERAADNEGCKLERGFLSDEEGRTWEWQRFEDEELNEGQIYLFKMHGSLDWSRSPLGQLTYDDDPEDPDDVDGIDLIFGTNHKLSYSDPYLYYIYSFRRYVLEAKLVVTIGYGFRDAHVNEILRQGLHQNERKHVLCVNYVKIEEKAGMERERIAKVLDVNIERVTLKYRGAKHFFEKELTKELVQGLPPERMEEPF